MKTVFIQTKSKEHAKVTIFDDNNERLLSEQFARLKGLVYISEKEYNQPDPMVVDIVNELGDKIGELETKKI